MADVYPNGADQRVPDDEWIERAGREGWIAITKDYSIIRDHADDLKSSRLRVFAFNNASISGDEMASRLDRHFNRILRRAASGEGWALRLRDRKGRTGAPVAAERSILGVADRACGRHLSSGAGSPSRLKQARLRESRTSCGRSGPVSRQGVLGSSGGGVFGNQWARCFSGRWLSSGPVLSQRCELRPARRSLRERDPLDDHRAACTDGRRLNQWGDLNDTHVRASPGRLAG